MKRKTLYTLIEESNRVLAERNRKYHGGGIPRDDYWRYGGTGDIITEIYRKTLTLISLNRLGDSKAILKELPDLMNYCRFLWALIKEGTTNHVGQEEGEK